MCTALTGVGLLYLFAVKAVADGGKEPVLEQDSTNIPRTEKKRS
jgi:hypothetical protein